MTPKQIIDGMQAKNRELQTLNDQLLQVSEEKAQKERTYNVARTKQIMTLKANKEPATLIPRMADGSEEVSKALYEFRVSEGMFKVVIKRIDAAATAIDTYRSILSWKKEEYVNVNIDK